jgi:hypothetical protein
MILILFHALLHKISEARLSKYKLHQIILKQRQTMSNRFGLHAPPVLIEPDSPLCKKRKSPPVPSSITVIISGSAWCDDDDYDDKMTLSPQRKDCLPDFSSLRNLSITASPLPPIKMQLIQVGEGDDSPKDHQTKKAVSKAPVCIVPYFKMCFA